MSASTNANSFGDIDIHVSLLLANDPLCSAIRDSGSCFLTTEVLQLTPNELRLRLIHVLKSTRTLSSDDRGHAICVLETSLWFCPTLPSSNLSCARYPLLPLELSADAPPLASQLPPGCGRLYFFISELEKTDAEAPTSGESGGTIAVSIPLLGVIHKIPFQTTLKTAEVLALCVDAFPVDFYCFFFKFLIAGVDEGQLDSKPTQFWTGNVPVNAELSCMDCSAKFEVRYAPTLTDDISEDDTIICHSCDTELSDESYFCCVSCERVICDQCMDALIRVR
ncbi:GPI-anchored surface protein, putative [Bodo saltans]|uniref:GPI-anchored surface protein, putative n=1 Tax=Bodo saltans TaxID=75058 RepID=A0A0S4IW73_BODSA|nr:GPI-anchored surface protein, putative [Bodo saltans]|eukprot:CUG06082.1 GPI-anchored surface protein, putative [Bodo saltans]